MYALMYPILYIASIHGYIPLSTATSMSVCRVCIVLWHDHVNGEIKVLKKKAKRLKISMLFGSHIGFLSGMVSKLLDIWYFCDYANLGQLG